jgi:hypothetical protein
MGCMEFRLNPVQAFSSGQDASGELVACTLGEDDLKNFNYIGLNLMICVNTNPLSDPTCEQGQWVTVINGACVEETVIAQVALQDYGNRLLIRIGGPGNLTACQPRWTLDIARTTGDCFTTDPGYGTCCDMACVHGFRITQTCFCFCSPGFTGTACDRMLPFLQVDRKHTTRKNTRTSFLILQQRQAGFPIDLQQRPVSCVGQRRQGA